MSDDLQAGDRLGGYEILRHLAAGGMAEVFVARSPVGRPVALKRIRGDLASDANFVQLFLREARIAITLDHPDIAQVLDVGEFEGSYFLVMELVEGISLLALDRAAAAQGQRIPLPVVVWIVQRIARALHHAHDRRDEGGLPLGIVHRDISPQNILLSEAGGVKLIDFGVARGDHTDTLTRPGVTRGKYLYFSPEQIKMQPLDGRSDLFALGSVLYEILLGHRAFDGELLDVLRSITYGEFVDPHERDPSLPTELVDICHRALRIKREARWGSGEEMAGALERWANAHAPSVGDTVVRDYLRHVASAELSEAVGHPVPASSFPVELEPWRRPVLEGVLPELATDEVHTESQPTTAATPMTHLERGLRSALVPLLILGVAAAGFGLWWMVQPPKRARFVGHRPLDMTPRPVKLGRPPTPPPPEIPVPAEPAVPARPRLPDRPADGSARESEARQSGWLRLRFELSDALLELSGVEPYAVAGPGEVRLEGKVALAGEGVTTTKLLLIEQGDAGYLPPRFVTAPGFELSPGARTLRLVLLNPSSFSTRKWVYPEGIFEAQRPEEGAPPIGVGAAQVTDPWVHRLPYLRIDSNWAYEVIPRIEIRDEALAAAERPKARFVWVATPVDLLQWSSRTQAGLTGDNLWGFIEEGETLRLDAIGAVWLLLAVPPEGVPRARGEAEVQFDVKQIGSSRLLERRLNKGRKRRRR